MSNAQQPLFADPTDTASQTGILPSQMLAAEIGRQILIDAPLADGQIQPSSIDLRLGATAYQVPASFLPGPKGPGGQGDVLARAKSMALAELDLSGGAVMERGAIYIVPLMESLKLRWRHSAIANPKSSTGRLDVFVRLIGDGAREFDRLPEQYSGPLYAEISPRSFHVKVKQGSRLLQLRIRHGRPKLSLSAMRDLHERYGIIEAADGVMADDPDAIFDVRGGTRLSINLRGAGTDGVVGYKARRNCPHILDLEAVGAHDPAEFFVPVRADAAGRILLEPDDFYILVSRELVAVPPDVAAEMIAYDTFVGEFRVHYAGFFDPGFGYFGAASRPEQPQAQTNGTAAVLEVRSHEVPFYLDHGQTVCSLLYHKLAALPDQLYGEAIGSNYARQGLNLSKHFKRPYPA